MVIDELIQHFCPNGARYAELGQVVTFTDGFPFSSGIFVEEGAYQIVKITDIFGGKVNRGKTYINSLPDKLKSDQLLVGGEILIAMSGSTGKTGYNELKNVVVNQRIAILRSTSSIDNGFLKHLIVNKSFEEYCLKNGTGPQNNISKSLILKYRIPLPPLAVQQEIVRILDSFTELTAELTAELTSRRKQYEHYRDELLTSYISDSTVYLPLEKCCKILDNKRKPVTKAAREAGKYPYYGANGIQDYVSNYIFDGTFVLVGEDGSVITAAGNPVVTWAEGQIWVNNHAHIIEEIDGVSLRYLYHYLQTVNVTKLIHGNIPKLTGTDFRAIPIPAVPSSAQTEIVQMLDCFDAICNDLTSGLPAEIEARQKQYEYYRDKLLTFKELER